MDQIVKTCDVQPIEWCEPQLHAGFYVKVVLQDMGFYIDILLQDLHSIATRTIDMLRQDAHAFMIYFGSPSMSGMLYGG